MCVLDDESVWQLRIITSKNLTQGQSLVDLTGEELKQLYDVVVTKTIPVPR